MLSTWKVLWKLLVFILILGRVLGFLIVPVQAKIKQWEKISAIVTRLCFEFCAMMTIIFSAYSMVSFDILWFGGWVKFQHSVTIAISIFMLGNFGFLVNVITQEIFGS